MKISPTITVNFPSDSPNVTVLVFVSHSDEPSCRFRSPFTQTSSWEKPNDLVYPLEFDVISALVLIVLLSESLEWNDSLWLIWVKTMRIVYQLYSKLTSSDIFCVANTQKPINSAPSDMIYEEQRIMASTQLKSLWHSWSINGWKDFCADWLILSAHNILSINCSSFDKQSHEAEASEREVTLPQVSFLFSLTRVGKGRKISKTFPIHFHGK